MSEKTSLHAIFLGHYERVFFFFTVPLIETWEIRYLPIALNTFFHIISMHIKPKLLSQGVFVICNISYITLCKQVQRGVEFKLLSDKNKLKHQRREVMIGTVPTIKRQILWMSVCRLGSKPKFNSQTHQNLSLVRQSCSTDHWAKW